MATARDVEPEAMLLLDVGVEGEGTPGVSGIAASIKPHDHSTFQ